MNKIRLHLGNLSVNELIAYARRIEAAMGASPAFNGFQSNLATLADEVGELIERHAAHEAAVRLAQERLAERNLVRSSLEALLNDLAADVARAAEEDTTVIQKSGFEARAFAASLAAPGFSSGTTFSTAA